MFAVLAASRYELRSHPIQHLVRKLLSGNAERFRVMLQFRGLFGVCVEGCDAVRRVEDNSSGSDSHAGHSG